MRATILAAALIIVFPAHAVAESAVVRGVFATAVVEREPVDAIESLGSDRDRIYYFNEFRGLAGQKITHRWEYQGEVMAEVPIAIGAARWRAYSSKNLEPGWLGEWTVSVIDESGAVLRKDGFVYETKLAESPTPTQEAPASPNETQP